MPGAISYHNKQWGQTEHAGKHFGYYFGYLVKKGTEAYEIVHSIVTFFTQSLAFATVKLDGTNVGKCAKTGELLGRRTRIGKEATTYIKTSLEAVREAHVGELMGRLCKELAVDCQEEVGEFIVYGELMCNKFYEYEKEGLVGTWQVFGAIIEDNTENRCILEKLLNTGYAARRKEDDEGYFSNQVQIFMNEKLYLLAKEVGLSVAPKAGEATTIDKIIRENKQWMKTGEGEGIVMTVGSAEEGFRIVKWKGAHEPQYNSDQSVKDAVEKLQGVEVSDEVRNLFKDLEEVIDDTSENKRLLAESKKNKVKKEKPKFIDKKKMEKRKENTINFAIKSALSKYDSPKVYIERGEEATEEFITMITDEVKKDIMEIEDEKNIKSRISKICRRQKCGINGNSKSEITVRENIVVCY